MYLSRYSQLRNTDDAELFHHKSNLLAIEHETEEVVQISLPAAVHRSNQSLYMHVFHKHGNKKYKSLDDILQTKTFGYNTIDIVTHFKPEPKPYSLVGKENSSQELPPVTVREKTSSETIPVVHLRSMITLSISTDTDQIAFNKMPADFKHKIVALKSHYLPPLHLDTLALRTDQLLPVAGIKQANLTLRYVTTSLPKLRLWMQMEASMKAMSQLGFTEKDQDEVKGIFDTNLYLLGITLLVSMLHLVFDLLAFKSDISFWRACDSMAGLSTGTVLWRAVAQIVIFLHLLEEDTSMLVLGPSGISIFIEVRVWHSVDIICYFIFIRRFDKVERSVLWYNLYSVC